MCCSNSSLVASILRHWWQIRNPEGQPWLVEGAGGAAWDRGGVGGAGMGVQVLLGYVGKLGQRSRGEAVVAVLRRGGLLVVE